jgi:hypothetical protein
MFLAFIFSLLDPLHSFRLATMYGVDFERGSGLTPNLMGSGVSWGVYFQVYNTSKRYMMHAVWMV